MTNQFSVKVSQILSFSKEEAIRMASPFVGPEHLLLGILREKDNPLQNILNQIEADVRTVKSQLEAKIQQQIENEPFYVSSSSEPLLNEKANNILKLAVLEARLQRMQTVDIEHLLLAMLHDKSQNGAKQVLEANHLDYSEALRLLQHKNTTRDGISLSDDEEDTERPASSNGQGQKSANSTTATASNGKTPILDKFSTDLTRAAAEGELDAVIGREREIERVTEILCRRKKNNPILIGEPGVGKSAIAEGLAQLIAKHHTSPILFNKRIVSLDMTAIVAGTKYRGQFEERIHGLLKEIEANPNIIVFIDEIHTLIGAGSTPGSMDAANIMKPALARGVIQCIGATTLDEFRNSIEKDGALERRFQKVLIEPTTEQQTLAILHNIKDRYEEHHHVAFTEEAIAACVKLTGRYITDRAFPDKAIDAMDEVGSRIHLKHAHIPPEIEEKEKEIADVDVQKRKAVKNQNFELAADLRDKQKHLEQELQRLNDEWSKGNNADRAAITAEDVADVVSQMSGVPVQRIAEDEAVRLRTMPTELKNTVIGQDEAIDKITRSIQRNRLGLKDPNRPIGVFMFLGPTGVGKTHLAQRLAEIMFGSKDALIRIDMSEYTESFNSSRLVGAPPGYVGYEEGGQLTEKVRRHPYSIVLLDEIEKAHGNVFNLLLQVLDEGRLTDGNGRMVDFRNTIIIMTSNVGTRQLKDFGRGIGFQAVDLGDDSHMQADNEHARSVIQKSLSKQFAPEFLNRLDEIITFNQLDKDIIRRIVDIELARLATRIEAIGYSLLVSDKAKDFIAGKGFDPLYGARPLKRAVQTYVEDGISALIMQGELHEGDAINVDFDNAEQHLTYTPQPAIVASETEE